MEQNPNPNSELSFPQSTNYSYNINSIPYQPTTIDPHNALYLNHPQPPGVDPSYVPPPVTVPYTQHPASYEPQQGAASTAAIYYQNPNAATYYQDPTAAAYYQDPNASWPAAITQFGATSYAQATTNPAVQPRKRNTWEKGHKAKQTKIVQSAWCEVCKLYCNSKGILDQHKLGKKHKKNVEKLIAKFTVVPPPAIFAVPPTPAVVNAPLPVFTSAPINKPAVGPDKNPAPIDKPIIGPEENPEKPKLSNSQKARKKAANARIDDLETKRRRVLEGGAATHAVRACTICNVVCNSDTVFNFHLTGQKHASMIKKYALSNR